MLPSAPQVLGFFNLIVGLMVVLSVTLFLGGFIIYLIRLGTWPTYRTQALRIMSWGIAVLFTLIIILAVQQFLARHVLVAVSIAAFIIILVVLWIIIKGYQEGSKRPENAPPR